MKTSQETHIHTKNSKHTYDLELYQNAYGTFKNQ